MKRTREIKLQTFLITAYAGGVQTEKQKKAL